MKYRALLPVVLGLAFSVSAFAEEAQTYPGPQEAAPNVYRQLFDNEKVRVSEIKFNPGDKAPMHAHPWPHAVYVIEAGQLTLTHPDGSVSIADAKAGDVLYMPAETHEAVNTGTTLVRATVTELKS